jgi:hypothetical protein
MQACTLCFSHLALAAECETSTLLVALQITIESGDAQVNFESDCRTMVNIITNGDAYVNELGIVLTCKSLISSNASYNLAFIRRQTNKVVHHNVIRANTYFLYSSNIFKNQLFGLSFLINFSNSLIVLILLFVMK